MRPNFGISAAKDYFERLLKASTPFFVHMPLAYTTKENKKLALKILPFPPSPAIYKKEKEVYE